MLLHELFLAEVMSFDMAKVSAILGARNLLVTINKSRDYFESDAPKLLVPSYLSRWFQQNYSSSRIKRNQGLNIQTTLEYLTNSPKMKDLKSQFLKLNMDREKKDTTLGYIRSLCNLYAKVLDRIDPGATLGNELVSAIESLITDLSNLDKEEKVAPVPKVKEKPSVENEQRARIEEIVNDILSGLNRDDAARIRQSISKSDNKLVALKAELDKMKEKGA